jgi:hypothetical protein
MSQEGKYKRREIQVMKNDAKFIQESLPASLGTSLVIWKPAGVTIH